MNSSNIAFYGFSKQFMVYEEKYHTWSIIDSAVNPVDFTINQNDYRILAVLNSQHNLPTGLKHWDLVDPDCNGTKILKFTQVGHIKII